MNQNMRHALRLTLFLALFLSATSVVVLAQSDANLTFSLAPPATFFRVDLVTAPDFTTESNATVTVENISVVYGDQQRADFSGDTLGLSLVFNSDANAFSNEEAGADETIHLPISVSGLEGITEFEVVLSVSPENAFDLAATAYEIPTALFAAVASGEETASEEVTTDTPAAARLVINELMADNDKTVADPQGDFDDWLELANIGETDVDLSGMYLSDNAEDLQKWQFPSQTIIPAGGYLVIWADDEVDDEPGLHANFKLSADGEILILADTDERDNIILDQVSFGEQQTDFAIGRVPDGTGSFVVLSSATPAQANSQSSDCVRGKTDR